MSLEVITVSGFKQSQSGETSVDFLVPKSGIMNLVRIADKKYSVNIKPEYLTGLGNIQKITATISNVEIL